MTLFGHNLLNDGIFSTCKASCFIRCAYSVMTCTEVFSELKGIGCVTLGVRTIFVIISQIIIITFKPVC